MNLTKSTQNFTSLTNRNDMPCRMVKGEAKQMIDDIVLKFGGFTIDIDKLSNVELCQRHKDICSKGIGGRILSHKENQEFFTRYKSQVKRTYPGYDK